MGDPPKSSNPLRGRANEQDLARRLTERGEEIINLDTRKGREGYHGGWPDLLTRTADGTYRAYEVSGGRHSIHGHQRRVLGVLRQLGVDVRVVLYDKLGVGWSVQVVSSPLWNPGGSMRKWGHMMGQRGSQR